MQNKMQSHLSSAAVRPHNRRLLLQILRDSGELSRAELSVASGLSPAAVTNVVADLIESGLVLEGLPASTTGARTRLGRPGTRVSLAKAEHSVLAVQIGAGVLQVGVCDMASAVLASESTQFDVSSSSDHVLNLAVTMVERALETSGVNRGKVLGLGVGTAGLVDRAQRINLTSQILGWSDVPMADFFEANLGVAAVVDHNVRAMAVGEARYGRGKGLESLVFVYIRSGVGVGLILGGRDCRGGTHGSAEIGHMRVVPNGPRCACGGRGCLETVITDGAVRRRMVEIGLLREPHAINAFSWIDTLIDGVMTRDARALAVRDDIVENLASGLTNLINLLNPQLIVLGGLLNDLSPIILQRLLEVVPPQVMPLLRDKIQIQPATFGADAGIIGAATVALDRFVFGTPLLPPARAG